MQVVPVNAAVVKDNVITDTAVLRIEKNGAPVKIQAVDGGKYILAEGENGVAPENITLKRVGDDLHVFLEGTPLEEQPQLIIEDFYSHPGELVGKGEDGQWHQYVSTDADSDHEAAFLLDGESSAQALGADAVSGLDNLAISSAAFSPALIALGVLGALAAAAGLAALIHHNQSDSGSHHGESGHGGGIGDSPIITKPQIGSVTDQVGAKQGPLQSGDYTDDTTPRFDGIGQPGQIIEIWDGDEKIGETITDQDGKWTYTPDVPMSPGDHDITVIGRDPNGNKTEPSDGFELIIDITAPDKAVLTDVYDDVAPVVGSIDDNGFTNDNRPDFSGTAEPNTTVEIIANGKSLGSAQVDENGNWTFTPDTPMADGHYDITLVVTDRAGNIGLPTDPFHFTVDTQAPGKPGNGVGEGGIGDVFDDVAPVIGSVENGGTTNDTQPELSGEGLDPGDVVTIIDNGEEIGTVIVDQDGSWTFTPDEPLNEGKHDFSIIVTDPAGNASEPSDPYEIIVDTQAPDKPAITAVIDNQGDQTGPINPGDTTDDAKPEIQGSAEPGSVVNIYDGDKLLGSTTADENGNWTFTPELPLSNGGHSLTAEAVDKAGNTSEKSDSFDFDLHTGGTPSSPSIISVIDDHGVITGNVQPHGVTDDNTPTINGTAPQGSLVSIYVDGQLLGTATANEKGEWSFTPDESQALSDGPHDITATATDAVGNISVPTGAWPIVVDTAAPAGVDDAILTDDAGPITGPVHSGDTIDDSTPIFSGSAEPGTTVIIKDNGEEIGRAPVDKDGNWTFTPVPPLKDGDHSFSTIVQDPAGNQSPESSPIQFIVDTTDVLVSIDYVTDDKGSVTGNLPSGSATDDDTPTLHGKAVPNGIVNVYDENGTLLGSAPVDHKGNWSFTPDPALSEGHHSLTATVVTKAGGESAPTVGFELDIDLTAPNNNGIGEINDDVGPIQGPIDNGGTTDDTTPTLGGGGQTPGDTVTIIDNGETIGTAIVDEGGNWTFTPDTPLNDGKHEFSTIITDPVGNSSEPSDPYEVIVDTHTPGKPAITAVIDNQGDQTGPLNPGDTTDDAKPEVQGTAEPGTVVNIYDDDKLLGSAPVDENGNWTFTPELPLSNGGHSLTAEVQDKAGNTSEKSDPFDFNLHTGGTPTAPSIISVIDDHGVITGNVQPHGVTDDNTPTINGTAPQGSLVSIYVDGQLLGTATADANGEWSFTPDASKALSDGPHDITATATDTTGNVSVPTGAWPIVVDTAAPAGVDDAELTDDVGPITGPVNSGDTTDDSTPTFSGSAEPGTTVIIKDNGEEIGRAPVDKDGNWTFTPVPPLKDGDHSFSTIVQDPAGNQSPESSPIQFIVDTRDVLVSIDYVTDDKGSVTGNLPSGSATDDDTPTLHGKAVPNAIVNVYDENGKLLGSAPVDYKGNWSFTPDPALSEGHHSLTATVVTEAGGESAPTAGFELDIDLTAPNNNGIGEINDDVGPIQGPIDNGGTTDDTTPTLGGGGQTPGDTVTIIDNGETIGTTIVDEGGNWTFTPDTPLNDGKHEFSTIITDPVGNSSEPSDPYEVIVKTDAPEAPVITKVIDAKGEETGEIPLNGLTDDNRPAIQGTAPQGALIAIYDGNTLLGTTVADNSGNWSFVPDDAHALSDGLHNLNARVNDAAGNQSPASNVWPIEVDATAPAPVTGETLMDDVGLITGPIHNGDSTDDNKPAYSGSAEPGTTVIIKDKGQEIGRAPVGQDGKWTFTPTQPLEDGDHSFSTIVKDPAGNQSPESSPINFTVDTLAPTESTTITSDSKDSGDNSADFLTNNGTAGRVVQGTLTAALAADEFVQLSVDGGKTWHNAYVDGLNWSFVDQTEHSANWVIQSRVIDAAGNTGVVSSVDMTLDTEAPAAPTSLAFAANSVTVSFDASKVILGDKIHLLVNNQVIEHQITQADINNKSAVISASGATYTNTSAALVDAAGNISDYTSVKAPMTVTETFDGGDGRYIKEGESFDFNFFTFENISNSSQWVSWPRFGFLDWSGVGQFALELHEPAKSVTMTWVLYTTPMEINYYNEQGKLLGTSYAIAPGSNDEVFTSFTAPGNEVITRVEYISNDQPTNHMSLKNVDLTSQPVAHTHPSALIDVNSAAAYYGGDDATVFSVADTHILLDSATSLHGNAGIDTLRLTGAGQTIDLTALGDKIQSVEVINITGTGNNTLKLSLEDVLSQGETDLFHNAGTVQMMVQGSAGDVVNLANTLGNTSPGEWAKATGTVTVGGATYDVYQHSTHEAELLVQQGVQTNLS